MMSFAWLAFGAAVGALVAWVPYGYAALAAVIALVILYAARYVFDARFRESPRSGHQMSFFTAFWIVIAIFYLRPSGMQTFLPPLNVDDVKVADLLAELRASAPNVEIDCDPAVAEKRISIHTVTRITLAEALDLIDKKAGAVHSYKQALQGRSIARGPRITVNIVKSDGLDSRRRRRNKPFSFDAF